MLLPCGTLLFAPTEAPSAQASARQGEAPAPAKPASPGEEVTRPEPGLARGLWEAPPAAFYAAIVVILLAFAYGVIRRFRLPRRQKGSS